MQHTNSKKAEILLKLISETIKEKRLKLNKSQRLLADEFEIEKSLISRLEAGKNEPKVVSLWSICEALEIKVSDFFKEIEDKIPENFSLSEK